MVEKNSNSKSMGTLGFLLALGLICAAFVLGNQFKNLRTQGSIEVKGLAEEKRSSDLVEWNVGANIRGTDYAEALKNIKEKAPLVTQFLTSQQFTDSEIAVGAPTISPYYEEFTDDNGNHRTRKNGFMGEQSIVITSKDLTKIEKARQTILDFKAKNDFVTFQTPQYLLSNLEEIKHTLIAKATEDAYKRATEFAKTDRTKVGKMRKASQGAFNIMSSNVANQEGDSWGGVYDKSTIDKQVRLVVTIEYGIE